MRVNRDDLIARCWSNLLVFEPSNKLLRGRTARPTNQKLNPLNGGLIMFYIKCVCHTSLKLRVALLRVNCSASACQRIVTDAKGGWGSWIPSAGACGAVVTFRTTQRLCSTTPCRTRAIFIAWPNCASHEPKIKTPQGRFNFWLGQLDSNQH